MLAKSAYAPRRRRLRLMIGDGTKRANHKARRGLKTEGDNALTARQGMPDTFGLSPTYHRICGSGDQEQIAAGYIRDILGPRGLCNQKRCKVGGRPLPQETPQAAKVTRDGGDGSSARTSSGPSLIAFCRNSPPVDLWDQSRLVGKPRMVGSIRRFGKCHRHPAPVADSGYRRPRA